MKIDTIIDDKRHYSVDDLFILLFCYFSFLFIARVIVLLFVPFFGFMATLKHVIGYITIVVLELLVAFLSKKFRFRKIWWFVFVLNFFNCLQLGALVYTALPLYILTVPIYRLLGSETAPLIRNRLENILSVVLKWFYKSIYYISAAVSIGSIFLLWLTRVNQDFRVIDFVSVTFWGYLAFSFFITSIFVLTALAETAKIEKDRIIEAQQTNED